MSFVGALPDGTVQNDRKCNRHKIKTSKNERTSNESRGARRKEKGRWNGLDVVVRWGGESTAWEKDRQTTFPNVVNSFKGATDVRSNGDKASIWRACVGTCPVCGDEPVEAWCAD